MSRPGRVAAALRVATLGLACVGFAVSALRYSDSIIDDAYIVFRYADNLLAGHGPVFNSGEWVEGFSSPLWLLFIAAARALGAAPEAAVTALGMTAGLGAILASAALARRLARGWAALVGPLLVASHPALAMWSVHGLETPLFVLLVAAAFAVWGGSSDRAGTRAGALFGLAFWTRPEAPLFVAILTALALLRGRGARAVQLVAGFLAFALPLLVLRAALYGSLVPNTFHAKTGGGAGRLRFGLSAARLFVETHGPLVVVCALVAGLLAWRTLRGAREPRDRRGVLPRTAAVPQPGPAALIEPDPAAHALLVDLLSCGAAWSAWVVWIGGDAFPGYRFWIPVLPLAGAVAGWLVAEAAGPAPVASGPPSDGDAPPAPRAPGLLRLRRVALIGAAGTGIAVITAAAQHDVELEYTTGREFTGRMLAVGDWLRAQAPSSTVIALNYVGAVPYRSGLKAIDMLGLTDPVVGQTPIRGRFRFPGHARGNGASVLDREPGLILLGGVSLSDSPDAPVSPELDSEEQIAADPRFRERYDLARVEIPAPGGRRWFSFYKRKDLAWAAGENRRQGGPDLFRRPDGRAETRGAADGASGSRRPPREAPARPPRRAEAR